MDIDQGEKFGTWDDEISKFLYIDSAIEILSLFNIPQNVADYGGGNGLLKKFIPNIITIDKDKSKNPDICEDILEHQGTYDMIISRYVLHYLNDYEVIELLKICSKTPSVIIQFVNDNLHDKYFNSHNELKYFRTSAQLDALLSPFKFNQIYRFKYRVTKEFYKNRLGDGEYKNHFEDLCAWTNIPASAKS